MDVKYLLLLIFINILFLFIGGIILHNIEHPVEEEAIKNSRINYANLLQDLSGNITCLNETEIDQLIQRVIQEYDDGNIFVDDTPNWDLPGSIFFASTIMTTIGYGHITLATSGGRVFCVFYALFGIPLCLIMLGEIGIRFSHLGQKMDKRLNRGWFPKSGKYFRPLIILVLGLSLFIFIPALILTLLEDWDYGTALYYGIITLTTVGFGDVVAGQSGNYPWLYHIALTLWILLGLAWVANLIANSQEIYKDFGQEILEFDPIDDDKDPNGTTPDQDNALNGNPDLTKL